MSSDFKCPHCESKDHNQLNSKWDFSTKTEISTNQCNQCLNLFEYKVVLIKCKNCKHWNGQLGAKHEWTSVWRQPIKSNVSLCHVKECSQPEMNELVEADGYLAWANHECSEYIAK